MATSLKKQSNVLVKLPGNAKYKIGIVVADWNNDITDSLLQSCLNTLQASGVKFKNCIVKRVPGAVEITSCAAWFGKQNKVDAVIVFGCVIKGDTPHFDYVCDSVTYGITKLCIQYPIPFLFGVLTTNNHQQAKDRAGGKLGNKGEECALAALQMLAVKKSFSK
ncbi:MAG: 6,7-dimethyl-8-ribityllumazine synthase [Bacteroidetes bacterium]|nr:6,7-dimethyl-8-ribityllumazine synthase [Bacteroidota bacterium]